MRASYWHQRMTDPHSPEVVLHDAGTRRSGREQGRRQQGGRRAKQDAAPAGLPGRLHALVTPLSAARSDAAPLWPAGCPRRQAGWRGGDGCDRRHRAVC